MSVSIQLLGSPSLLLHGRSHSKLFFPSPSQRQRSVGVRPPAATAIRERRVVKELQIKTAVAAAEKKQVEVFKITASVTVKRNEKEGLKEAIENSIDALGDKLGRNIIVVDLVSNDVDPKTRKAKVSKGAALKGWLEKKRGGKRWVVCTAEFEVDSSFGVPGAITVANNHRREFYLESVVVEGFPGGAVHFTCNSWVQSTKDFQDKRVFFTNQPYLPSETPAGLRELRQRELKELRGNGTGERKLSERVYDYAVYNDLGNPDKGIDSVRPILGGESYPYPRRCRTGRPPTSTDKGAESRVEYPSPMYVPRDEGFEEEKVNMLKEGAVKALLHNLVPSLVAGASPESQDFRGFHEVDNLFKQHGGGGGRLMEKIPLLTKIQGLLRYDTPHLITKDKYAWMRDDEFARQTLAGINPASIERLQMFPPMSKLDPSEYGPPESAIKEEHLTGFLDGLTVQQALEENKLYILNYHDAYLPFVDAINAQDGRKTYATRTIFFLTSVGTLKPIVIELGLPPAAPGRPAASRVVTPPADATSSWQWQLAKAHVISNDAGIHQLVNHWLRTHACTEPFILAAHRQLSAMHPIHKLLAPHMRYTLEINAIARQFLINAGGVIESGFSPGKFSTEMSSAAYRHHWRFDKEGLPADLIRRGMATEESTQEHGLRLMIEDYPYANDGLLIWSALKRWVGTYVDTYYRAPAEVQTDSELQAWYYEAVNVGHKDKAREQWWPRLETPEDVAGVLTTLIWLVSAQHAALNFGQYPLGSYVPSRPPMMRRLLPTEGDAEHAHFVADPQRFFLAATPGLGQAATFMTVIDTLSTHSTDEEYLGERQQPETWTADAVMLEAFRSFAEEVKGVEREMERRNADPKLRNRCGAGVLPYELMMPSSGPGITCRGVPNSVTI